ncbi:ABC-2 type transport system ATP-binding protein [Mycetocola sp. CAN_C7]|uniref:ABC transporter ATP-binding protein n=1 Tax=Mycetocola sp. CAN_C7 TaxID=2787724 RepID=UPI0018CA4B72
MTDEIARIDRLCIRRAGFEIPDMSFTIPRGSVVGMVGPNGAGKTTVIRTLLGLIVPDSGDVRVFDRPAGSPDALARIGIVLDQPTAAPEWRVDTLGRRLAPFYADWDAQHLNSMLDRLSVPRSQRVGELSRGQGVKLTLATALAQHPELLILDEPSSGLDPASRREIGDVIREFMVDPTRAVLFSTHITTDLDGLADELIMLANGRIAHRGALPDITEEFALARGTGTPPIGNLLGLQRLGEQWSALIRTVDSAGFGPDIVIDTASIDDIVIHLGAEYEGVSA